MIPIISLPLPNGGTVLAKTTDIGGATSNSNATLTDVYILGWASKGITVDMRIEDFAEVWVSALFDEPNLEYETVYADNKMH